jgi:pimeloyl-ACP methyl ester carboxylesterase
MTIPDGTTESSTLALDDGDVYVCQDGPHDAPALVLIHGSASSARSWDALVPMLTGSHRVIRVDLLGHGRSAKPDGHSYATPDQARRVGQALDRLGVEHAMFVGHSSGGVVVTALAERRPDLVTALVLINTGPSLDAFIAAGSAAIDPTQWPPTDEQIRQFASTGFSRADYRIPQQLLAEVRAMTYSRREGRAAARSRTLAHPGGSAADRHTPAGLRRDPRRLCDGTSGGWRMTSEMAIPTRRLKTRRPLGSPPEAEETVSRLIGSATGRVVTRSTKTGER